MLPRSLTVFSHLGVFLISVKAWTTKHIENKTTPKICKITVPLFWTNNSMVFHRQPVHDSQVHSLIQIFTVNFTSSKSGFSKFMLTFVHNIWTNLTKKILFEQRSANTYKRCKLQSTWSSQNLDILFQKLVTDSLVRAGESFGEFHSNMARVIGGNPAGLVQVLFLLQWRPPVHAVTCKLMKQAQWKSRELLKCQEMLELPAIGVDLCGRKSGWTKLFQK